MKKATILTVLTLLVSLAYAQPDQMRKREHPSPIERQRPEKPDHPDKSETIPGLSDQQKEKIKKIRVRTGNTVTPLKNKIGEERAHLKFLVATNNPDKKEVDKTIEEIGSLQTQIMRLEVNSRIEIRSLLNDEQKLHFDRKIGQRHQGKQGQPDPRRQ